MDTVERQVSEEMEDAVKKAVADAHEVTAEAEEKNAEVTAEAEEKKTDAEVSDGQQSGEAQPAEGEVGEDKAETGESDAEADDEDGKEPEKMDIFGRRNKKELEKRDEQIRDLNDRFMRLMAEFDNFRKRTEKEKSGMYAMGARDVIEKILPVLDNFERGFALVAEEDRDDPFTLGMEKIYKQFTTVLADLGVTPIDAVGKEFDPNLHNAVMHVEDESLGENIVAEELQKGYMYKDTVLRYSMVKVAN